MPYKSLAQEGWAHTKEGTKALGGSEKVKEWDAATKGSHLPERVQHFEKGGPVMALSKGDGLKDAEYAKGGGTLDRAKDFKKADPQGRGDYGRFLSTKDRFTGHKNTTEDKSTDENWTKPKGVGHTDKDDKGDSKSLKPVKPRG